MYFVVACELAVYFVKSRHEPLAFFQVVMVTEQTLLKAVSVNDLCCCDACTFVSVSGAEYRGKCRFCLFAQYGCVVGGFRYTMLCYVGVV